MYYVLTYSKYICIRELVLVLHVHTYIQCVYTYIRTVKYGLFMGKVQVKSVWFNSALIIVSSIILVLHTTRVVQVL